MKHPSIRTGLMTLLFVICFAAGLATALAALAFDLTWTGAISGDWNNPANWSPPQVPVAGDHVIINSGDVSLTSEATFAVLDWNGGLLRNSLVVGSNSVLNIDGAARHLLLGALINEGLVRARGSAPVEICGACGGMVENREGGLIDLQSDHDWNGRSISWPPLPQFRNAGILRKSGGAGVSRMIAMPLENTGTVEALTGSLELYGDGAALAGDYVAAAGARVIFLGQYTLVSGPPSTGGAGQVIFSSDSSVRFSGPITNFTLDSGNLVGPAIVTGILTWNGGYLRDPLTIASGGMLNIDGNAYRLTYDGRITNAGLVQVRSTGGLDLGPGPFHNLPGGVVDLQVDQDWLGRGATLFRNEGIVRKSGGSGTNRLGMIRNGADYFITFENTGTVEARIGTIYFGGAFSQNSSGNMTSVLSGTTPGADYGRLQFSSPPDLSGTFAIGTRNGFHPIPGDSFRVLGFPSISNEFSCFRGLDLGAGLMLVPQLSRTALTLTSGLYETNRAQPQMFIGRSPGGIRVVWPQAFPDWTLQSTVSLSPPSWMPVPTQCDNQIFMPAAPPERYFRLSRDQ